MNPRIEPAADAGANGEGEFSKEFIRILVALTGATLIIVFLYEHDIFSAPYRLWPRLYLFPWVVAGGQTIGNALSEFRGNVPALLGFSERIGALLGLLFGFVIGPTLFFFGWYSRRKDRASGAATPSLKGSTVISIIGGILTFSVAVPAIPAAVVLMRVSANMRAVQAVQSNKDLMINEINDIAFNAYQYRILPRGMGGGQGSYSGYALPAALSRTPQGSYTVTTTADEVVVVGTSAQYADATLSARVDKEGRFEGAGWKYTGSFE